MKRILLMGLLAGIALAVIAAEPAKEGKATKSGSSAQTSTKAKKPYGCYKNLKWGMTPEQAMQRLGIKLEKSEKCVSGAYCFPEGITIGEKRFSLDLVFESSGLIKVIIGPMGDPPKSPTECSLRVGPMLDNYKVFKKTLEDKFGKPSKDVTENKGEDINWADSVCKRQARLSSEWETEESNIALKVELVDIFEIPGRMTMYIFENFLKYEKKNSTPKTKVDL